ncbi:MAG: sensor domain-containing diguanylate cyclase [Candidatus Lernaella stagnicola]|nr:sensor domain-containing diguanylate cyclase [Candidatus Lernaella stagnicola]
MSDNHFYRDLLESLYDGVYFVDHNRRIQYWNRAAEELSGFGSAEVVGHSCADNLLCHVDADGNQLCFGGCPLHATLQDGLPREVDVFLHHKDGHRVPVNVRVSPRRDKDGNIIGAVEVFRDNRQKIELIDQLVQLEREAMIDPLTGLPNRRATGRVLDGRFGEYERLRWPFGVMFFDVDHFKTFNDSYGHEAGDAVLKMVAGTLRGASRSYDFPGRWGGEEFVVVAANVDRSAMEGLAERFRMLVAESFLPWNEKKLSVTVSVGASLVKDSDDAETLVSRADELMYRSKKKGRNRVSVD